MTHEMCRLIHVLLTRQQVHPRFSQPGDHFRRAPAVRRIPPSTCDTGKRSSRAATVHAIRRRRVALFTILYPQVIVQMMLFFALLFWLLDLTPTLAALPMRDTMMALIIAMAVRVGSNAVSDTE